MLETALTAVTTLFATIGPVEAAIVFATLTQRFSSADRRAIALKATLIATLIILAFALFGQYLLRQLGVGLAALQTAGGIILLLIAIEMIFGRQPGAAQISQREKSEAEQKAEITVFPLATPLLAGPGAINAGILLAANTRGDPALLTVVVGVLVGVMALTAICLLLAQALHALIGFTAQKVIERVMGILLAALAVQSIFNGIAGSGMLAR